MNPRLKALVMPVLALGLALCSCRQPVDTENFILSKDASDGVYIYSLPLTDTTALYDFWFYARSASKQVYNLELKVQWLSPSGESLSETVYMKEVSPEGSRELYRSGMKPSEAGDWQLSVRPVGTDEDFYGLGVISKRRDGTR